MIEYQSKDQDHIVNHAIGKLGQLRYGWMRQVKTVNKNAMLRQWGVLVVRYLFVRPVGRIMTTVMKHSDTYLQSIK